MTSGRRELRTSTTQGTLEGFFDAALTGGVDQATKLLRFPETAGALHSAYGLPSHDGRPSIDFSEAELIEIGRETVVVQAASAPPSLGAPQAELIIKFLRPEVFDVLGARRILREEAEHPATEVLWPVEIPLDGPTALILKRAPGTPVLTWMRQRRWLDDAMGEVDTEIEQRVEAAAAIGAALCRRLGDLESEGANAHGNINYGGTLIDERPDGIDAFLVDAGWEPRLGREAEATDPPEFKDALDAGRVPVPTAASDAYAVGVVLLQLLASRKLEPKSVQTALSEAWGRAPRLARIVEDLVDRDPSRRMGMIEPAPSETRWHALGRWIDREYRITTLLSPERVSNTAGPARGPLSSWPQVRRYFHAARQQKQSDGGLKWTLLLAYALWVLCWTGFLVLTAYDLGFGLPGGEAARLLNSHAPFQVGNIAANGLGRLVGLLLAYVGMIFYTQIVAGVTVRRLGMPLIEATLRLSPLLVQLPAVYVIYYQPQAWPAATALAALSAAAVCWALVQIDKRALDTMQYELAYRKADLDRAVEARVRKHTTWPLTLATSGVFLGLLAVLLSLDDLGAPTSPFRLVDKGAYAVLIALGIGYGAYGNSIKKIGTAVKGCVEQSAFVIERARRLVASGSQVSVLDASVIPGAVLGYAPAAVVGALVIASGESSDAGVSAALVWAGGLAVAVALVAILLTRGWDAKSQGTESPEVEEQPIEPAERLDKDRSLASLTEMASAVVAFSLAFAWWAAAALAVRAVIETPVGMFLAMMGAGLVAAMIAQRVLSVSETARNRASARLTRQPREMRKVIPRAEVDNAFKRAEIALDQIGPVEASRVLVRGLSGFDGVDEADGPKDDSGAATAETGVAAALPYFGRDEAPFFEQELVARWAVSPRLGRLIERLSEPELARRFVVRSQDELRLLQATIAGARPVGIFGWRERSAARRAEVSLGDPLASIAHRQRLRLAFSQVVADGGLLIVLALWLYYTVVDPALDDIAVRTLAVTNAVCVFAYYRATLSWFFLDGLGYRWLQTFIVTWPFLHLVAIAACVYPTLWPMWAVVGIGWLPAINFPLYRLATEGSRLVNNDSQLRFPPSSVARHEWRSWAPTSLAYIGVLLMFVALLQLTGVLQDGWFYALVIGLMANLYALTYNALRTAGPEMRAQVLRALVAIRVREHTVTRRAFSVPDVPTRSVAVANAPPLAVVAVLLLLSPPPVEVTLWVGVAVAAASVAIAIACLSIAWDEALRQSNRAAALIRIAGSAWFWGWAALGAALVASGGWSEVIWIGLVVGCASGVATMALVSLMARGAVARPEL